MITTNSVAFDFPADWTHFTEGTRVIFQSPAREEVIVSAHSVTGHSDESERIAILEKVFQNGLRSVQKTASDPRLHIIKPLAEDRGACALHCWTVVAESLAQDVFFAQAVIRHASGTVLLTYEAPFQVGTEQSFHSLLGHIYELAEEAQPDAPVNGALRRR